jgi:hypothetical protein
VGGGQAGMGPVTSFHPRIGEGEIKQLTVQRENIISINMIKTRWGLRRKQPSHPIVVFVEHQQLNMFIMGLYAVTVVERSSVGLATETTSVSAAMTCARLTPSSGNTARSAATGNVSTAG